VKAPVERAEAVEQLAWVTASQVGERRDVEPLEHASHGRAHVRDRGEWTGHAAIFDDEAAGVLSKTDIKPASRTDGATPASARHPAEVGQSP
jgi:hypothetical protein